MTVLLADIWIDDITVATGPTPADPSGAVGAAVPDAGRAGPAYLKVKKAGTSTVRIWAQDTEGDWTVLDTAALATTKDELIRITDGSAFVRLAAQPTVGANITTSFGFGQSSRGF